MFLIAGARLGDRYGRRTLFLIGAWSFVGCSTLCAVAPDTSTLIAGRLPQGASAALLIPQGLGLMRAAFRPDDLGKAFSVFGPVVSIAAVAGPVLGGLLVDANLFGTGWRLVFLINLPIGVLAALGAARLFPESAIHAGLTAAPYALGSVIGALLGAALLVPRLGRKTLQIGSLAQGAGLVLLLAVLAHTQMHVTTWDLAGPLLVWGIGMGLVIASLFDFVLSALTEDEVGSGSGVLNALQQLGSAIGVAIIGTIFFSTLTSHTDAGGHPGYITGLERCAQVGTGVAVAAGLLAYLLPSKAREANDPAPPEVVEQSARLSLDREGLP